MVEPTHLKNISQIGSFSQVGLKINNIWNHHPVLCYMKWSNKNTSKAIQGNLAIQPWPPIEKPGQVVLNKIWGSSALSALQGSWIPWIFIEKNKVSRSATRVEKGNFSFTWPVFQSSTGIFVTKKTSWDKTWNGGIFDPRRLRKDNNFDWRYISDGQKHKRRRV